jgi:hypothetical protein
VINFSNEIGFFLVVIGLNFTVFEFIRVVHVENQEKATCNEKIFRHIENIENNSAMPKIGMHNQNFLQN